MGCAIRVGMTLLRVDSGIDTGPILFHGRCEINEIHESHVVIQYRAVIENLDAIGQVLLSVCRGEPMTVVNVEGRTSAAWGQPRLTDYLRWKWAARKNTGPDPLRPELAEGRSGPAGFQS